MFPMQLIQRLPPLAALTAILGLADGQILPRATRNEASDQAPSVTSGTSPTAALEPVSQGDVNIDNSVCGYIGGDPALPATCSAGSHCAVHLQHSVVGCCPNYGKCSRGIFTACVDRNSGPQTVRDPYVYTCAGSDLCYKNSYDGGNLQFGCGSASGLATSVATSAPGRHVISFEVVNVPLTEKPVPLMESPILWTQTPTPLSTPTTSSHISFSATRRHRETGSAAPSPSATDNASALAKDGTSYNTAAIIGGIMGGSILFFSLIALAIFIFRRRKVLTRQFRKGPLASTSDSRTTPGSSSSYRGSWVDESGQHHMHGGPSTASKTGDSGSRDSLGRQTAAGGAANTGTSRCGGNITEPNQMSTTRDLDGSSALMAFEDDGTTPRSITADQAEIRPAPRRSGGGVLWQQNRERTLNSMRI